MRNDLRRILVRLGLKANAQPAMGVVLPRVTARHNGIGENEKLGRRAALRCQALHQQLVLVFQHRFQTLPADITIDVTINRVADRHVVGGDGLGDGARRAADAEEPARDLLARADLGEGAILAGIEVDLQRLLMCA